MYNIVYKIRVGGEKKMNIQGKVDDTTGIFNQSIDVLSEAMKGVEKDQMVIRAAMTSMNNHVKLINAKKGEEMLALAKKRIDLDWATAMSENKIELKRLLNDSSKV